MVTLLERSRLRAFAVQQQISKAQLEYSFATARLHFLQVQLRPHFLFNAFNSLLGLMIDDRTAATAMVEKLRAYYRASLDAAKNAFETVERECELAREYLDVERLRFGQRLCVSVSAAPDVRRLEIPTLLLQPLVENAVKHGVARRRGPGFVNVNVARHGTELTLEVANSGGDDRGKSGGFGFGLRSTHERLSSIYGSRYTFDIVTGVDSTYVRIRLPI
jgi:LytS/YehU family sensor histidine kinase